MQRLLETIIYNLRWILAPIYMGLSVAVLLLGVKFFHELAVVIPHILTIKEVDLILITLTLIDIALVGGLLVMVMLSGYENFVSTLHINETSEKLAWLGKIDSGGLKNKVAASIVAISSIHLLKVFMNTENIDYDTIKWYVIVHLTFVGSAFAMGYLDKIARESEFRCGNR
ncbi:TIGR00645 family protein [Pseudidiomarina indica]|mgnify:FL=1|uniref:UPF0114 protein SAMN02927930_01948 n=1 Tax=Pseudidiomarina indica TaxID=1159017 RepID=A0A1G6DY42_9GAMM|nr:TIGR00645 family protein [Pseudidiomarina indica]SDB50022.1 TIGR00645 family protein [Pseudidiomarina indica]